MLISSWSKNLFPVNNRIGDAQRCSFRTGSLINYYNYMILLDIHESSHDPETESEILVQYSVCNEHLFFGSQNIYSEHLA